MLIWNTMRSGEGTAGGERCLLMVSGLRALEGDCQDGSRGRLRQRWR